MRSVLLVLASAVLAVIGDAPVHAERPTNNLLPSPQLLSRVGLERVWAGQATLNPQRDKVLHFVVDEDMVYVQATSGEVTAFDSETGRRAWSILLGRFDTPGYPAVSSEDEVLIVVGPTMFSLDKDTGQTRWQLRVPDAPSTGVGIDEAQVYVGTLDGNVYAYNRRRIRQLFEENMLPAWSNDAMVWKYAVGGEITSPPIPTGRVVNLASKDGSLYAVTASRRELIYQLETNGPIDAPVGFATHTNFLTGKTDQWAFLASRDQTFYAVDAVTGRVMWDFTLALPITRPPFAVGYDLFLLPARNGLHCLNQQNGEGRWPAARPGITDVLAVTNDVVYALDVDNALVALSRVDGALIGTAPMRRFQNHVSNELTDRVYMATDAGTVICMRPIGKRFPTYHRHPERLPILPQFAPENPEEEANPADAPAMD